MNSATQLSWLRPFLVILIAVTLAQGPTPPAGAAPPNPVTTTTLVVPVEGNIAFPANPRDVVHVVGKVRLTTGVTIGAEDLSISLYIRLLDTRGVGSSTGATYTATGGAASRQFRFPPSAYVPPQPIGSFTANFRVSSTNSTPGDSPAQLPITFSFTFDEDGTLTEATAILGGDAEE
jgi:hypothetical protein